MVTFSFKPLCASQVFHLLRAYEENRLLCSLEQRKKAKYVYPENIAFFHVHEAAIPLIAPEKKSRPLSAKRRTKSMDKVDDDAQEIFKAMAEENQTIGES